MSENTWNFQVAFYVEFKCIDFFHQSLTVCQCFNVDYEKRIVLESNSSDIYLFKVNNGNIRRVAVNDIIDVGLVFLLLTLNIPLFIWTHIPAGKSKCVFSPIKLINECLSTLTAFNTSLKHLQFTLILVQRNLNQSLIFSWRRSQSYRNQSIDLANQWTGFYMMGPLSWKNDRFQWKTLNWWFNIKILEYSVASLAVIHVTYTFLASCFLSFLYSNFVMLWKQDKDLGK